MSDPAPKAPKKKSAKSEAPRFDQSLGRLEEIVAELEQGGLGLEDSLEQYKEGVALLKGCREQLAGFRAQVQELSVDGLRPHAGDPDFAPGPGLAQGGARSAGVPSDPDAPF
ncbi:Exodeoxyribonuclease 7 small subunit [Planctomycetes bacterium Poly30]|uniref:Exodeoxyribonuclease 7 small subunit n=1 Tax=Saltatorellus ferox TaxID=2528018 RepID=A0A518ETN6_9BACT|nr:Exodeoxyribonuclease 7 small subunit [Planctomycetes bacterium Poly30]